MKSMEPRLASLLHIAEMKIIHEGQVGLEENTFKSPEKRLAI